MRIGFALLLTLLGVSARPAQALEQSADISCYNAALHHPQPQIYDACIEQLIERRRFDDAIALIRHVNAQWPDDPLRLTREFHIAEIHMRLDPPDVAAARAALQTLTQTPDEPRWRQSNQTNPYAMASASALLQQALAALATDAHRLANHASQERDPLVAGAILGLKDAQPEAVKQAVQARYTLATELYTTYIARFPDAPDVHEMQAYLGTTLSATQRLAEADQVYEALLAAGDTPYRDAALWQRMQVRREQLIQCYGAVGHLPADAVVEHEVPLKSGRMRAVYTLSPAHARFIEAADALSAATLTDPDYVAVMTQFAPALAFLPAQILFNYGRFDEARPRLERILQEWPQSDEAAFSASLMVDSYAAEDDLSMVRSLSGQYRWTHRGSNPVNLGCEGFPLTPENLAFNEAVLLIETDRRAAAAAFLQFTIDFPSSTNVKQALYNAANSYEIIGEVAQANSLFEQYVNLYPRDERSPHLLYRAAMNYANVLELEKAVQYWESILRLHPTYPDAPSALYNAGFLRIGLGDHEGAARLLERYATDYPAQRDAEQVLFLAGNQWEQVNDAAAAAFYNRYLKRYPDANPDHILAAHHALASIADRGADPRRAEQAWSALLTAAARLSATAPLGVRARMIAGEAALRPYRRNAEALVTSRYTNDLQKKAALLQQHAQALARLEQDAQVLVSTWQDFTTSSGALTLLGEAWYAHADAIRLLAPGSDLPAADQQARTILASVLSLAERERSWSTWQSRALAVLAEREPSDYNPEWNELRATFDGDPIASAGPIELRTSLTTPH